MPETKEGQGVDAVVEIMRLVKSICREKAVTDHNSVWKLADREARELRAASGLPYHQEVVEVMRHYDRMSKDEYLAHRAMEALR